MQTTNTVTFRVMDNLAGNQEIESLMALLYEEDPLLYEVDRSRFSGTIAHLVAHPHAGQIVIFEQGGIVGYSVLIPYWSNEFGGTLLFIDELYVKEEMRNRGIGHRFFEYLETERPYNPVAFALEVTKANTGARRLYESLGFSLRNFDVLVKRADGAGIRPAI